MCNGRSLIIHEGHMYVPPTCLEKKGKKNGAGDSSDLCKDIRSIYSRPGDVHVNLATYNDKEKSYTMFVFIVYLEPKESLFDQIYSGAHESRSVCYCTQDGGHCEHHN